MEERFFSEDHGCKHVAEAPHIYTAIVFFVIEEDFWWFVEAYAAVVLSSWLIELG